jgi:prepilin-type processing-associated H-X9-DG protein
MNSATERFVDDPNKILLVEYRKPVADLVDSTKGLPARDTWDLQQAPRHAGMTNILYVDGHTGTVSPDDIDPSVPEIYNTLWKPMTGKPH